LQVECGLTKAIVDEINNKREIKLRAGVLETFNMLSENNIPILILSSAVGDFIEFVLADNYIFYSNVYVISNFYDFDKSGKVIDYKNKIIHTFNKNEASIKSTSYFSKIKNKSNII